jgi:hypothetical protein
MKLLLIFLMLFNQSGTCPRQDNSSVRISVVSQKKFRNRGHHPENNRKVVFRLVNESGRPVFIYGFKYDGGFDPTGYLMSLNNSWGEWEYPNPNNRPNTWNEFAPEFKDKRILKPNESITFNAELSELEVGTHFRRTVYASYNENDEPCEIRGDEFVLK